MITLMRVTFLAAIVMMIGCRKNPMNNLTEEEQRIYITNREAGVNFSSFRTFSIASDVVVVDGGSSRQQNTIADQALIQAIARGLQSRGFTPAPAGTRGDIGVQVSRIVRTSTGFVTGPDYWGAWNMGAWGFGGGWGPGWGWGSGWGPGWTVMPYEVREGMLAVDIIDLTNSSPRILWNALVRGPGLSSSAAADDIVNNLLSQSPYLQTN